MSIREQRGDFQNVVCAVDMCLQITALMEVQNRQKEQRDSSKRRRRDKALSLQGGGTASVIGGNTGSTGHMEKTGSMPVKVRFT